MRLYTSGEDYLKAIYIIQRKKGTVRSVDVSEHMEVSKPSVSHAVKLLCEGGFLTVDEDHILHLTNSGKKIAEQILERHQYFMEQLTDAGVETRTAEAEACRIEHTLSDQSFQLFRKRRMQLECPFADTCKRNNKE